MAKRTITILKTGFHNRGEKIGERNYYSLSNVKSRSHEERLAYKDLVQSYWDSADLKELDLLNEDRSVHLEKAEVIGDLLLLKGKAGHVGEPGDVHDTSTGEVVREDGDGTISKRSTLRIAYGQQSPNATVGYYIVEHSPNGNLRHVLEKVVRHAFAAINQGLTVEFNAVLMDDDWAELQANIDAIQVTRARPPQDDEERDEDLAKLVRLTHEVRPGKKVHVRAGKVLSRLRGNRSELYEILSIDPPKDRKEEEVRVRLKDGKRSKTMVLDDLKTPPLRELVTDSGQPPLSDLEFVEFARERIENMYDDSGLR